MPKKGKKDIPKHVRNKYAKEMRKLLKNRGIKVTASAIKFS